MSNEKLREEFEAHFWDRFVPAYGEEATTKALEKTTLNHYRDMHVQVRWEGFQDGHQVGVASQQEKLERDDATVRWIIRGFLDGLPDKRDWLDPNVERAARAFLSFPTNWKVNGMGELSFLGLIEELRANTIEFPETFCGHDTAPYVDFDLDEGKASEKIRAFIEENLAHLAPSTPQPQPIETAPPDEHALFEAWFRKDIQPGDEAAYERALTRLGGGYKLADVHEIWQAWEARANIPDTKPSVQSCTCCEERDRNG